MGWRQLCTRTPDKRLAQKMESMWAELADRYRAWDILERVLGGTLTIGTLYDLWIETRLDVEAVRRRLADVDLVPLVDAWHAVHRSRVAADTADHALAHARHFFPAGSVRMASSVTTEWLARVLAEYPGKRNTRRKVHSNVSGFLDYCTDVRGLYSVSPMAKVARPKAEKSPPMFYEHDVVERIVDAQPTTERRVLFALLYGTGIEISVALKLTRDDVLPAERSVRARGTKTHTRQRVARVADWAWPIVWAHAKHQTPLALLFTTIPSRWTASDWHRWTVGQGEKDTHGRVVWQGLNLPARYPLKNARHHWAATRLRAGVPLKVVQEQLGHATPTLTLDVYGEFIPTGSDRDAAETKATEHEAKRRARP